MALDAVKNFARVTVSTGYDASATSIALTGGHGALLPAPATDGLFNLVWWNSTDYSNPSDDPNKEIVRCTARSTDTLTVTRAQEGTTGSTKNTSSKTYKMVLATTAKMITDIQGQIQAESTYRAGENVTANDALTLIEDIRQPFRAMLGVDQTAFGKSTTYQQIAIKFIPRSTYSILNIKVYLSKTGTSPGDGIFAEIQGDASGSPDNSAISNGTSNTIDASSIYQENIGNRAGRAYKENTISFAVAPSITSGTTYWLVFKRSGALSDTSYYHADMSDVTYGDFVEKFHNGATWSSAGGSLIYFKINPNSGNRVQSAYKASSSNIALSRVDGFARETTTSGNNVTLVQSGNMTGFSSLESGKAYFLSTGAALTTSRGQYGGNVGVATSATSLHINLHNEVHAAYFSESNISTGHDYILRFNINFAPKIIRIMGGSTTSDAGISNAIYLNSSYYWAHSFCSTGTGASVQALQANYMLFVQNGSGGGLYVSGAHYNSDEYFIEFIITGSANVSFVAVAEA